MTDLVLEWRQDERAGVPLNEHVAQSGAIEAGRVMYDASNRFWVWSSPFADDAWGYGQTEDGAKRGFEAWLRTWLENFRPLFESASRPA